MSGMPRLPCTLAYLTRPVVCAPGLPCLMLPVLLCTRSFEVLYTQLGLSRLVEFIQLGLLDHSQTITMKVSWLLERCMGSRQRQQRPQLHRACAATWAQDLQDSGCISTEIQYGVQLYGKGPGMVGFPLHLQVCCPG